MFNIIHEVKDGFLLSECQKSEDHGQVCGMGLVDHLVQMGRRTSPEESLNGVQQDSCSINSHIFSLTNHIHSVPRDHYYWQKAWNAAP
jgi:hypothetical protein